MPSVQRAIVVPVLLAVALLSSAVARAADGGIYLYLQPLPADASRLTFTIGAIAAVNGAGTESALKLNVTTIGRAQASRQRLLASGRLPFGSYPGFMLTITRAALNGGGTGGVLTVPDAPVRLNVPFVAGTQPTVIWLTLRYADSIGGTSFTPVFSFASPPHPIADRLGFVSNAGSDTVTVFDKQLAQVTAVLDTCAGPSGMVLDQQRRRLYVACSKDDEVRSIDVATGEIVERSRLSPGDGPREVALTPDGATLMSVNTGSNSVTFYDALSLVRRERLSVGSGPASILVDPAGRRAFVLNTFSNSVSVIDLTGRTVLATLSTESAPLRAGFSARGDRIYVIHDRSPYMTVLDPGQLTVVTRVRLRIGVRAIAVDTTRQLVCLGGDDATIEFYDPNALMPLYSVRLKSGVSYLAFDVADNGLYALSSDARTLALVRLADRTLASEIDVGSAPYAAAVMGEK